MKTGFRKVAVAIAATAIAAPALAEGLTLTVDGVRNADGAVLVLVFDHPDAFAYLDWRYAVKYAEIPARVGQVTHHFPDLTGGPYALFVFHDENGDKDLNYDSERVLEGVGASGATTPTAEPDFDEAAVRPGAVTVPLFYDQ